MISVQSALNATPAVNPPRGVTRIVWAIVLLLAVIGVAIVTRRTAVLLHPASGPPRFPAAAGLDSGFGQHPVLTMVHIFPALVFVLLAPLQFVRTLRTRRPRLHRWMGRIALICGLVTGISALIMSPQMAIGGANETAATTFFAVIFLFSLVKAFVCIRGGKVALHREWMIRAFTIAFAVATIRPIVGIFFATSRFTHLTPHDFFGIAFWLGFTVHLIAAEVWINYTRPRTSRLNDIR